MTTRDESSSEIQRLQQAIATLRQRLVEFGICESKPILSSVCELGTPCCGLQHRTQRTKLATLRQERDEAIKRLQEAVLDEATASLPLPELAAAVVSGGWRLRKQRDELVADLAVLRQRETQIRALVKAWRTDAAGEQRVSFCADDLEDTLEDAARQSPPSLSEGQDLREHLDTKGSER
jgi:hypothetical protein